MDDVSARQIDWSVYIILDPSKLPTGRTPIEFAETIYGAGVDILQLRAKSRSARETYQLAVRLVECTPSDRHFIVNDRLDIALAADADGVHLGPDDLPVEAARNVAPSGFVVGASAGCAETAEKLERAGADYLGCGAVYSARQSKPDASRPKGTDFLEDIAKRADIPIVGIGGITTDNARDVKDAGADGVAVIREIVAASAPAAKATQLFETVN